MNRITAACRDERGVALVMAMIMLVAMTGLMLAFLSVSAFEPQISQNLTTTSQARGVADAGLEWGFDQMATVPPGVLAANGGFVMAAQTAHWNAMLARGQISGVAPMQIPGPAGPMDPAFGMFVVIVGNDNQPGDTAITGLPPEPAANVTSDTNGVVIMTATGTVRGVSRTITAAMRRPRPMNFDFNGGPHAPGRAVLGRHRAGGTVPPHGPGERGAPVGHPRAGDRRQGDGPRSHAGRERRVATGLSPARRRLTGSARRDGATRGGRRSPGNGSGFAVEYPPSGVHLGQEDAEQGRRAER